MDSRKKLLLFVYKSAIYIIRMRLIAFYMLVHGPVWVRFVPNPEPT